MIVPFILLCTVLVLGLYAFNVIGKFRRFAKMMNVFPGRKGTLIMGNVADFSNDPVQAFNTFRNYSKEFPKGYRLWCAMYGVYNINTPDDAEVILSNIRYIKKSLLYKFIHPWLETGLLTSTAAKWQHRRKILTSSFHFNILLKFVEVFGEHNRQFVETLKAECAKTKTDVMPLLSNHTLNILCETAMGLNTESIGETKNTYFHAIHRFGKLVLDRSVQPAYYVDPIFNLTAIAREQYQVIKVLHNFTENVIREREKNFNDDDFKDTNTHTKKRLAMLDLLLYAKRQRGEINDRGIREEVDTFMFEGHDTTAMGLTFILMLLANHKEAQKRIVQELDEIFGDSDRAANYQDLQNMRYLEICLKECLRLYPSVPLISREVEEDIPLRDNYVLPKGCIVHIHVYDMHRNKEIFPEPEKFDPDRFLLENSKNRHPFAYIPFSAGPRNCIGQKFAMLELKSIVSTVLRYYEMDPIDTPETIVLKADLVLRPANGVYVKFRQRTRQ